MPTSLLPYLAGGAGLVALSSSGALNQVKAFFARMQGVFLPTIECDCFCKDAVSSYCWSTLRHTQGPFMRFTGWLRYIRPLGRYGAVAYPMAGGHITTFWKGWRPLFVRLDVKDEGLLKVRYLRWTFDPNKFIQEATLWFSSRQDTSPLTRFHVRRIVGSGGREMLFRDANSGGEGSPDTTPNASGSRVVCALDVWQTPVGWTLDEIGEPAPDAAHATQAMALSADVEAFVDRVRRWSRSKDWYSERMIPWRMGALLEGPPGTGKSALTKAIGQELDLPIFFLDIATMDNKEFHKGFREALASSPAIVLVEDIDAVFHGRENVASEKGKGLTFDCFLNALSGVESADGLLVILTTNDMSKIDSALVHTDGTGHVSRPGRIDHVVHMGALDTEGRWKLARRIMAGCHESWILQAVAEGGGDTGAQFQLRCSEIALRLFWEGTEGEEIVWAPAEETANATAPL